jgi:translation initiation factor IF-2
MKIKIKEVATELGKSSKEIIEVCKELGIENVKAATSSITPEQAMKVAEFIQNPKKETKKEKPKKEEIKEEPKKEEKKSASSIRKPGIRIVRKAKVTPKKEEKQEAKSAPKREKQAPTPPKPKKPKKPISAKEKGSELQINREIAEIDTIEENQVELLDLSFVDIKMELEEDKPKKPVQNRPKRKRTR